MFRKLFCTILAFIMIGLCACNKGNSPTAEPSSSSEPVDESPVHSYGSSTSESSDETPDEPRELTSTVYYDDHLTEIGGISVSDESVSVEGDCIEIISVLDDKYFHAKGIGEAVITSGDLTCRVTVEKAKINIIVIMGQSNSGNHFANSKSDITNPRGTAYWWGNGIGAEATAPAHFTQATLGFHSTLLAELYAQSVKAGDPVKNVLVWHEGGGQEGNGTSKNGSSIYGWAASPTDTSGTDYTVEMVNDCVEYYEAHSDTFEIVSRGVYWLQGEGDGGRAIAPAEYTSCFMAMWNKLKAQAGLEYMAIMRVRYSGGGKANNDIDYTTVVASQFALANDNPDIFMATTVTESFVGAADVEVSVDISNYITLMEKYSASGEHSDFYGNTATYKDGMLTTTMKSLFGSNNNNHYGKFGYTIIGADAAYNMYRALNKEPGEEYFAVIQANNSGAADPENRTVTGKNETVTLEVTGVSKHLSFYAAPGSPAGTLSIKVVSGGEDVTDDLIIKNSSGQYRCVSARNLKKLTEPVTLTATYTKADGTEYSVTYNIVCK